MSIEQLRTTFGIPGAVEVSPGVNDLPRVTLRHHSGARAEIYNHGAHVTAWTTAGGEDLLFVSRASHFAPQRPIRGGIPVIFPQFGGGSLPQHGLARISAWTLSCASVHASGAVEATWKLSDSPESLALWPHRFALELGVLLDEASLTITMQVVNTDTQPFAYHAVLHTYFQLADVRAAAVRGLEGVTFIDCLRDDLREVETRREIRVSEEIDRVYVNAPDTLRLVDEVRGRTMTIEKTGMPDAVVWNPWIAKAQRMPDFGDDEYPRMICVETGIMEPRRTLDPGARWQGRTRFRYC